jgi:hypothetical protein
MNSKTRRAQSILEYVITLTVIIAAILASSSYMKSRVQQGMNTASDLMVKSLNDSNITK